jgi:hypothetical protein
MLCRQHTERIINTAVAELDAEDPKTRLAACRLLLEYGWGKPTQHVEMDLDISNSGSEKVTVGVGIAGILKAIEQERARESVIDAEAVEILTEAE